MLREDELVAIRERVVRVSPGPWHSKEFGSRGSDGPTAFAIHGEYPAGNVAFVNYYSQQASNDADFIAHARTDIPRLLDAYAAAEARSATLEEKAEELERELQGIKQGIREYSALQDIIYQATHDENGEWEK